MIRCGMPAHSGYGEALANQQDEGQQQYSHRLASATVPRLPASASLNKL